MPGTISLPSLMPGASASAFIGTFGVVLALIVFFLLFDTFVARIDSAEARARAASEYQQGIRSAAAGKLDDAADHLRTAISVDRNNTEYELALARVILQQGDTEDAEQLLRMILQRDPTDGMSNMLLAHVFVRQRRIEDATAYYHRAIYGRWRAGEGGGSLQARFELIDLLAAIKARKDLLAELLAIQDQSLDDPALRDSIGHLFIVAGSPTRAAEVFRQVLQLHPKDPRALKGLGESSLALGDYGSAEDQLAKAARLVPHDSVVNEQLSIARALYSMDPSRRGLRLTDRYARSRNVLQSTLYSVGRCTLGIKASAEAATADSGLALSSIRKYDDLNDAIDANLALAQRLWSDRPNGCPQGTSRDDKALALLQEKLSR